MADDDMREGETEPGAQTRHGELLDAIGWAEQVMGRTGGILEQIANGDWDDELDDANAAVLTRRISAMAETVRLIRAKAHNEAPDERPRWPSVGEGLPLNRKERFWTGTVLPAIISCSGFANLDLFLALCKLPAEAIRAAADGRSVELYTEYNLTESTFTDDDKQRFPHVPTTGDTPDLILIITAHDGETWLVLIEAKMFHTPGLSALTAQLSRQAEIATYLQRTLRIAETHTRHLLLTPEGLNTEGLLGITWQHLLTAYEGVAPTYWTSLLGRALNEYPQRRSAPTTTGMNADGFLIGADIITRHGAGTLEFAWMGCAGGMGGKPMTAALAAGTWRTTSYQVAHAPVENHNWFPIARFIAQTTKS